MCNCLVKWKENESSEKRKGFLLLGPCINKLPVSHKFTLYCLICKNGSGPLKYFFTLLACVMLLNTASRRCQKDPAGGRCCASRSRRAPSAGSCGKCSSSSTHLLTVFSGVSPVYISLWTAFPGTPKDGWWTFTKFHQPGTVATSLPSENHRQQCSLQQGMEQV